LLKKRTSRMETSVLNVGVGDRCSIVRRRRRCDASFIPESSFAISQETLLESFTAENCLHSTRDRNGKGLMGCFLDGQKIID
jgi:hypothetical protein